MSSVFGIVLLLIAFRLILYIAGMFVPIKMPKYRPIIKAPVVIAIKVPKQTVHSLYAAEYSKKYPYVATFINNGYRIESIEPFVMSCYDSIDSLL